MDAQLINAYEEEVGSPFNDSLTGLYNHGLFQILLERELQRFERRGDRTTLAMIDIDWFSVINRRRGHQQGDRILKEVAQQIQANIRQMDVACRYANDQFVVLYIDSNLDSAMHAAERIRHSVEANSKGEVTVSIGLAPFTLNDKHGDPVIENARKALYEAKMRGKNQVFHYQESKQDPTQSRPRVLLVDDSKLNIKMLSAMLIPLEYEIIKAYNGEEALHIASKVDLDLVLLDVMMPGMDGFEVCRRLKNNDNTRMTPVVLVTTLNDSDSRIKGIESGADDFITKPPNKTELLARTKSLIKLKRLNHNLTSIENVLFSMAKAVEAKDAYTQGHVERTANLAITLGRKMNLNSQDIEALRFGGILHDIGKIGMPNAIINKPGKLNDDEWKIMKAHPQVGYEICLPLKDSLGAALEVIRYHHEKLDGSGYPVGLKAEQISSVARIMAVADIYDALTSDRSYRQGMSKEKAFDILRQEAGEGKLDMKVVEHLIGIVL